MVNDFRLPAFILAPFDLKEWRLYGKGSPLLLF